MLKLSLLALAFVGFVSGWRRGSSFQQQFNDELYKKDQGEDLSIQRRGLVTGLLGNGKNTTGGLGNVLSGGAKGLGSTLAGGLGSTAGGLKGGLGKLKDGADAMKDKLKGKGKAGEATTAASADVPAASTEAAAAVEETTTTAPETTTAAA